MEQTLTLDSTEMHNECCHWKRNWPGMKDRARLAVDHVHLEIKNDIETHSDGGQLTNIGNEAVKLILR
jgi:hypothetical protein